MRFSENWLREFVSPEIDIKALENQLSVSGLEVEAIEREDVGLDKVVVGHVVDIKPHEDADRLRVCTVNVGIHSDEFLQIVCGAKNFEKDVKIFVAMVGANLPCGLKIKKSKIRGVASFGMICSKDELGFLDKLEKSDGIWVIDNDAEIGMTLVEYLQLNDNLITLGLTPNRGDCLSILGIAREVAALNNIDFKHEIKDTIKNTVDSKAVKINISDSKACPIYMGCIINDIDNTKKTPSFITEILRKSNIKIISPIVDILNYVMLEIGQPMHAFNLDKIGSNINIRFAEEEKLVLLDETEVKPSKDTLVISDETKVLALAGVMGGLDSAVNIDTKNIFIESAHFNPDFILGKTRQYGINTDSAYRFERGVDPKIVELGLNRAAQLILEITGGKLSSISKNIADSTVLDNKKVDLRYSRVKKVLGLDINLSEVKNILLKLGFCLVNENKSDNDNILTWDVPSFRFDIGLEEDLLEEIARVYGYDNIPVKKVLNELNFIADNSKFNNLRKIKNFLANLGYLEAINYSFVDSNVQDQIYKKEEKISPVKLLNPISQDMNVMRQGLLPGFVKNILHNQNHQQHSIRLFELGNCFSEHADMNSPKEYSLLGCCQYGGLYKDTWDNNLKRNSDFYDLKADLELLFAHQNISKYEFRKLSSDLKQECDYSFLHPGMSAIIYINNKFAGYIGVLHPKVQKNLGLDKQLLCFELDTTTLVNNKKCLFNDISKYPAIHRDLAFVVNKNVEVDVLLKKVRKVAGKLLTDLFIFDIYQGKGINPDSKSIALSIVLQHKEKTLVDEDINSLMDEIIATIIKECDAVLRD
tara:strand:+ start:3652 stop:6099 length:2448 start_codon:yes stop_codon:yes gene_type:complete